MKFSWKTTLGGIAAILTGVASIAGNGWQPTTEAITALIAGLGLLFAKDHNVSGTGSG